MEEERAELIRLMCEAYCRTSDNGGGRARYAKAMVRVLDALEVHGWKVERKIASPDTTFHDYGYELRGISGP